MIRFSKKIVFGFFCTGVLLSACVLPEKEDPFERLSEEKVETISGKIFPFSVSVSTRATHRLEESGKLQAYLASKVVRLEDFEGRIVEVDGVFRTEKMRPIFWVEKIRLKDIEAKKAKEVLDLVFETKKFRFVYPKEWEYTTAPNGTAYFLDKTDQARRVFLTFSVEELNEKDKKDDPNILIANLAGTKEVAEDDLKREREKIVLFSNIYDKKYTFIFTHAFEEFEKKKAFFKLLNSLVEGEENIQKLKDEALKKLAEEEKAKLEAEEKAAADLALVKEAERKSQALLEKSKETDSSLLSKIFGEKDTKKEEVVAVDVFETEALSDVENEKVTEIIKNTSFENLINEKAFVYESAYYKFSMKVPYGFWFRNFGAGEDIIAQIGFSNQAFTTPAESKFWLQILGTQTKVEKIIEKKEGEKIILEVPRTDKSFFELSGPVEFRDALWSIAETIESF